MQAARIKSSFIQNKHIKPRVSGFFFFFLKLLRRLCHFSDSDCSLAAGTAHCSSALRACVRACACVRAAAAAHMACRSLFIVCWALPARSPRRSDGANEPPTLSAAEMWTRYGCSCRQHRLLFQMPDCVRTVQYKGFPPPGVLWQTVISSVTLPDIN